MIHQFLGICKVVRHWFISLIYFVGVKLAFGWWKIGTFKNINSRAFIATTFLLIYAQKMLWLTTSWVIYSTNKFDQLATTSSMIWWMRINKNVSIYMHKLIYCISFMNFVVDCIPYQDTNNNLLLFRCDINWFWYRRRILIISVIAIWWILHILAKFAKTS